MGNMWAKVLHIVDLDGAYWQMNLQSILEIQTIEDKHRVGGAGTS
jgi:phosphoribosylformimino-5-aminoimidazole carboxamide ribonucleotide (ProFAR) isomerase